MRVTKVAAMLGLLVGMSAATIQAGEVTVEGVHLCCGACLKAVGAAFEKVEGASEVKCDRDAKTVTFQAADNKGVKAGLRALTKAGFHGTAKHDDKKVGMPKSGAKKGDKADEVVLTGVHLCCGMCVKAADEAVKKGAKDGEVTVDKDAKTVTVTGKDINVMAVVNALNKAGFHGKIKKEKAQ